MVKTKRKGVSSVSKRKGVSSVSQVAKTPTARPVRIGNGVFLPPGKLPASLARGRSAIVDAAGNAIVGVDEAGRGPWAGPVVAAAVAVEPGAKGLAKGITDSKLLRQPQREWVYEQITNNPKVRWSAAVVSHSRIDHVNILQATYEAMTKAVSGVAARAKQVGRVLIDGNGVPPQLAKAHNCEAVIQGDKKQFVIAAASIIAKVTRDRLMDRLDRKHPQYKFKDHKGYGTRAHVAALKRHGASPVHRQSYKPIQAILKRKLLRQ